MAMKRLILNTIKFLAVPSIAFPFFAIVRQPPLCEDNCKLVGHGCDGWSNVLSSRTFFGSEGPVLIWGTISLIWR